MVLSESPVFIVVLPKSRLCASLSVRKTPGFPLDFLGFHGMEKNEARQKRRELRPKGRQAYLVSTPVFSESRAVRSRTATTSSTAPAMPEGG